MEGKEENRDPVTVSLSPAAVVTGGEENLGGLTVALLEPAAVTTAGLENFRKKRGRPRKYGPDGKPVLTLSPMPISVSIPLTGDFPGWKHSQEKPISSIKRKQKLEFRTPAVGERVGYSVGANFTPHVMTVGSGEDVNMKIISFAQKEARAICVLAANGAISKVTLRQPNSCGGTLTYEGWFDILSLSGAFTPNNIGGAKGRSGGMSVSLAGPDGRVLGGGLAGMLVAAGPIQVILGSFTPDHHQDHQNPKKSRLKVAAAASPPPMAATPIFKEPSGKPYGNESTISFTPTNTINFSRDLTHETNGSFHVTEPKELKTSPFGVSC